MTRPALTKFRLLLSIDVLNFAWPVIIAFSPTRTGYGIAVLVALLARAVRGQAAILPDVPRTKGQRRGHAILTVSGYLIWISGIVYADIRVNDPAVWPLSSVFIPILGVFCYGATRVNLGFERPWGTAPYENI